MPKLAFKKCETCPDICLNLSTVLHKIVRQWEKQAIFRPFETISSHVTQQILDIGVLISDNTVCS